MAGTSSMVAAICYAWLLENKGQGEGSIVAPVINIKRGRMWKHRQAAWLFQHVGIDVTSLLFSDEVRSSIAFDLTFVSTFRPSTFFLLIKSFDNALGYPILFVKNMIS